MSLARLALLVLFPLSASAADPATCTVRVVGPDGKPAAGAKVTAYAYETYVSQTPQPVAEPAGQRVDAKGTITLTVPEGITRVLFARDEAGRVASAQWEDRQPIPAEVQLKLIDVAKRSGRMVKADGSPAAGVAIQPTVYTPDRAGRGPSIELTPWVQTHLSVTTDADGRFTVDAPAGYGLSLSSTGPDVGHIYWSVPSQVEQLLKLPPMGDVRIPTAGIAPALLEGKSIQFIPARNAGESEASRRSRVTRYSLLRTAFDADGRAAFTNVPLGTYSYAIEGEETLPFIIEKVEPLTVAAGPVPAVSLTFVAAAQATGTVVAADTGKGVAGVQLMIQVTDGQNRVPLRQLQARTDKDGRYTAYGPAGWYKVWLSRSPDGYVPPPTGGVAVQTDPAKLARGGTHEFPALKLIAAVTFTAQVLKDGKPAAGAVVGEGGPVGHRLRAEGRRRRPVRHPQPGAGRRRLAAGAVGERRERPRDVRGAGRPAGGDDRH